jgi:hypothetical protein
MTSARAELLDLGYSITPDCLSPADCDALCAALAEDDILRSRAGARHLMSRPAVAALANGAPMIAMARGWLGGAAVPFRATLFEKSLDTNWLIPWHQDTALPLARRFDHPGWGPWSEKGGIAYAHAPAWALGRVIALRVHLDASDAGNGPLRVIPRSHLAGLLDDEQVLRYTAQNPEVECLTGRGGVIAMRPLTIHCSSKAHSDAPRRVLHIEYADSLQLADGIHLTVA